MLISILAPYAASPLAASPPSASPDARTLGATAYPRVRQVAPAASPSAIQGAAPRDQAFAQWTALLDQIQQTWEREHKSNAIPTELDPRRGLPARPAADLQEDRALMARVESSDSESNLSGSDLAADSDSDSGFEVGPADLLLTDSSDDEGPLEVPGEEPRLDPPRAHPSGGPEAVS